MSVLCQFCNLMSEHVQPYQLPDTQNVAWICPRCDRPAGAVALPVSCVHECYRPGLNVYVSPAIRDIHPESPCAVLVAQTCEGIYYPSLEIYESCSYATKVPVLLPDGRVFF